MTDGATEYGSLLPGYSPFPSGAQPSGLTPRQPGPRRRRGKPWITNGETNVAGTADIETPFSSKVVLAFVGRTADQIGSQVPLEACGRTYRLRQRPRASDVRLPTGPRMWRRTRRTHLSSAGLTVSPRPPTSTVRAIDFGVV